MMSKSTLRRVLLSSSAGLLVIFSFQNCGPTFVTDAAGNIVMSELGSDSPVNSSPSLIRQFYPGSDLAAAATVGGLVPVAWEFASGPVAPGPVYANDPIAKSADYYRRRAGQSQTGIDGGAGGSGGVQ